MAPTLMACFLAALREACERCASTAKQAAAVQVGTWFSLCGNKKEAELYDFDTNKVKNNHRW